MFQLCYFPDDLIDKIHMKASKTWGSKDFVSNQKRTKNPSRKQTSRFKGTWKGRVPKP